MRKHIQAVREALGAVVVGGGGRVAGGFASTLTAGGFVPFNSVAAEIARVQSFGPYYSSYANTMQGCVDRGGRLIVNQCDPGTGLCTYKCQDANGSIYDITQ